MSRISFFLLKGSIFILFLSLPYYLFDGNLFLGGDDTRLYYSYPNEWIRNISFSSWLTFSSLGQYNPNQFILPLLYITKVLYFFIPSKLIVSYFYFSLPFILGFLFLEKFLKTLIPQNKKSFETKFILIITSFFFVTSPILLVGQISNFLYSVWIIPIISILLYYFSLYVKTSKFKYVVFATFLSLPFSIAFVSIPWFLGILIPILLGSLFVVPLYTFKELKSVITKFLIFSIPIILIQSFWLIPFLYPFFSSSLNSMIGDALSNDMQETFASMIEATANGSIIYPLLNLPLRQIAFDFNWSLTSTFLTYYDYLFFFNFTYLLLFLYGITTYKKYISKTSQKIFLLFFGAFIFSLFFFVVNIGHLKSLFIFIGETIPGFAMFRNAFDKFALGYIFIYSILLFYSFICISKGIKNKNIRYGIYIFFFTLSFFNFYPIKEILVKPLWTTNNIQLTTIIPDEYKNFMEEISKKLDKKSNILSIPFGISSYTIVNSDFNKNHAYIGRSPVKLLSDINDFSGNLSFNNNVYKNFYRLLQNYDEKGMLNFFEIYNIKYILVSKNINKEIKYSYLFDKKVLESQNSEFFKKLIDKKLIVSSNKNFEIYSVKNNKNISIISFPQNIYRIPSVFKKFFTETKKILISYIFNNKNTFNTKGINIFTPQLNLIPLPIDLNKKLKLKDEFYTQIINNKIIYLDFNKEKNNISVSEKFKYTVNGKVFEKKIILQNIPLKGIIDPLIEIESVFYIPKEIINIPINRDKYIRFYSKKSTTDLLNSKEKFTSWNKEDCNNFDTNTSLIHNYDEFSHSVILKATNNHNACIYKKISLNLYSDIYSLEFEHFTNIKNKSLVYVELMSKKQRIPIKESNISIKKWNHKRVIIQPSQKNYTENFLLYFYSGKNNQESKAQYKNIKFNSYSFFKKVKLSPDKDIKIHSSILVKGLSTFTSFYKENFLYKNFNIRDWNQGDCNNYDESNNNVFFNEKDLKSNRIILRAIHNHNACIYKEFNIQSGFGYILSFEILSSSKNKISPYISFDNSQDISIPISLDKNISTKVNFSIIPSPKDSNMTIYLYSGQNKNVAQTEYSNIYLKKIPKNYFNVFLLQKSKNKIKVPIKSYIKKISNHKYDVHLILNSYNPFILDFHDSFSEGWGIYSLEKNELLSFFHSFNFNFTHFPLNNYSNGWEIDPKKLCEYKNNCTKNKNGEYHVKFSIIFYPQKYFYIGLWISFLVSVFFLFYLCLKSIIIVIHHIKK